MGRGSFTNPPPPTRLLLFGLAASFWPLSRSPSHSLSSPSFHTRRSSPPLPPSHPQPHRPFPVRTPATARPWPWGRDVQRITLRVQESPSEITYHHPPTYTHVHTHHPRTHAHIAHLTSGHIRSSPSAPSLACSPAATRVHMTRPHPKVKASPSTSSSPLPHFHSAYAAPMSDLPGRSSDPTQAVQDGKHLSPGAADRQMASSSRVKRSHSPGSPSTSASPGSTAGRLSRASVTDPLLHRRRPSDSTSRTKTHPGRSASPDWNDGGGSSQAADESMIMRRRENNRLAAQRFRNRKKSYQESLEEKVKGLEVERGALLRRLEQGDDSAYPYNRSRSSPTTLHREYYPYPPPVHRSTGRPSSPLTLPDGDLRSASLESANRRLQDQLNTATEENERLRKTLDQWIQYGRSLELERRGGPDALHPGSEVSTPLAEPMLRQPHFFVPVR